MENCTTYGMTFILYTSWSICGVDEYVMMLIFILTTIDGDLCSPAKHNWDTKNTKKNIKGFLLFGY